MADKRIKSMLRDPRVIAVQKLHGFKENDLVRSVSIASCAVLLDENGNFVGMDAEGNPTTPPIATDTEVAAAANAAQAAAEATASADATSKANAAQSAAEATAAADVEALAGRDPSTLTKLVKSDKSMYAYGLNTIPSSFANTEAVALGLTGSSDLLGFEIGGKVTTIGNPADGYGSGAFQDVQTNYGSLVIPDSVTSIGGFTFFYNNGATGSLVLGKSIVSIGDYAFYVCENFTGELTIPDSVTSIGSYAFYACSSFTSLSIGSSVTTINFYAFQSCSGFTGSVTIPASVTSIGQAAFQGCSGLTNVNCYVTRTIMNAPNALVSTGVTTIHARASDSTWTAGADTIGGKAITVIKDL